MRDDEYRQLLHKAKKDLPDSISRHERFSVPIPETLQEGKNTVWKNFQDTCDVIHRDTSHVFGYLLRVLGTPGDIDGRRVVLKSKLTSRQIKNRLDEYVSAYVICNECGLPDTKLEKEGRVNIIRCMACGAHRPVK